MRVRWEKRGGWTRGMRGTAGSRKSFFQHSLFYINLLPNGHKFLPKEKLLDFWICWIKQLYIKSFRSFLLLLLQFLQFCKGYFKRVAIYLSFPSSSFLLGSVPRLSLTIVLFLSRTYLTAATWLDCVVLLCVVLIHWDNTFALNIRNQIENVKKRSQTQWEAEPSVFGGCGRSHIVEKVLKRGLRQQRKINDQIRTNENECANFLLSKHTLPSKQPTFNGKIIMKLSRWDMNMKMGRWVFISYWTDESEWDYSRSGSRFSPICRFFAILKSARHTHRHADTQQSEPSRMGFITYKYEIWFIAKTFTCQVFSITI